MKKVMLLVVTVMLISAFLMASGPSLRVVKLTIINKSGNEIMIKLEGSDVGKQFYYLTIPAGDKDWPTVRTFTVLEDYYTRTTWYGEGTAVCVGMSSSGTLVMDRNNRLVFTPCYSTPKRTYQTDTWTPIQCIENPTGDADGECLDIDVWANYCANDPTACELVTKFTETTNAGEPSMEKVAYYKEALVWYSGNANYENVTDAKVVIQHCGGVIAWRSYTREVPDLCMWRYGY